MVEAQIAEQRAQIAQLSAQVQQLIATFTASMGASATVNPQEPERAPGSGFR